MENNKELKTVQTSCPFPLLLYRANIRYNEVRKPSGIAYILLELITESGDPGKPLGEALREMGVPEDIHHIFRREMANLIRTGIADCPYTADEAEGREFFRQVPVGDFYLTAKGEKMFREGYIPTGEEKTKRQDIYYNPVTRRYATASAVPFTDLATTSLGDGFRASVSATLDISGMGDYIAQNPKRMGLKAEERIVSFEPGEPEWKAVREEDNLSILIGEDGVRFRCATTDAQSFFDAHFSSAEVSGVLMLKKKYKFYGRDGSPAAVRKLPLAELRAQAVYIPDEIQKQADRPCQIFAQRGRLGYDRKRTALIADPALSERLLGILGGDAEFALFDAAGCRYYVAAEVQMPCERFGDTFGMQLLAERTATPEGLRSCAEAIYAAYADGPVGPDGAKAVSFAAQASGKSGLMREYAEHKLSGEEKTDAKIDMLLRLNDAFRKTEGWADVFSALSGELFDASASEVTISNTIYKDSILRRLGKAMGLSSPDYVTRFTERLRADEKDPAVLYGALDAAGFSVEECENAVSIVGYLAEAALEDRDSGSDTQLGASFGTVRANLWGLNRLLGIESLSGYTAEEEFSADQFFLYYGTLSAEWKKLSKYRQYAPKEYGEIERYLAVYEPIHSTLTLEKESAAHPENITEEYVDRLIAQGKYRDAVCDTHIKLQHELRKILNAPASANAKELIDAAQKSGLVSAETAGTLHTLRRCRNAFQHPEAAAVPYSKETVTEWKRTVFSLRGGKR